MEPENIPLERGKSSSKPSFLCSCYGTVAFHEFEWMFFVQQTQKFSPTLLAIFLSITWDMTPFFNEFLLLYNVFIIPSGFSAHTPINQDSIGTIHVQSVDLGNFCTPKSPSLPLSLCFGKSGHSVIIIPPWISLISRNLLYSLPKVRFFVFSDQQKPPQCLLRPNRWNPRNKRERGAVNLAFWKDTPGLRQQMGSIL